MFEMVGWDRDKMLQQQSVASDRAGGIIAASRFIADEPAGAYACYWWIFGYTRSITPGTMIAASIIMGRASTSGLAVSMAKLSNTQEIIW